MTAGLPSSCMICGSDKNGLLILVDEQGIPPGQEGHGIYYYRALFARCEDCGSSQLEELEHDCFNYDEEWDRYEYYVVDPAHVTRLSELLKSCHNPLSAKCECPIHEALRASLKSLLAERLSGEFEPCQRVYRAALQVENGMPRLKLKTKQ